MMFARISAGEIASYPLDLKTEYPFTAFPTVIAPSCLPDDVVMVMPTTPPQHDHTQRPVEGPPEFDGTNWKQTWELEAIPQAEIDASVEAAFTGIRAQRNALLTACDWTQVDDTPLTNTEKQAWAVYRQALRDFPATTSDPFNPEWPTPPS